jgi:hypothetical protein
LSADLFTLRCEGSADAMNGRQTFETIYKKLEKELHERKKEMVNVLEISNIAYEARDQAYNEISALRAQNDKELMMFEAEKVELNAQVRAVLGDGTPPRLRSLAETYMRCSYSSPV